MSKPVFEIAILARATWNLHSLNNEGTVGNATEPRTVVLADGRKTDAISGEMLKQIHSQHLWCITPDKSQFCDPCKTLQPQRADKNDDLSKVVEKSTKKTGTEVLILDAAIRACVMCDLHGFLRTKDSIPRPSTVEFGWAVALPGNSYRDHHVHARHVIEGRSVEQGKATEGGEQREGAAAQMVYHRPTRSGIYALVSVFQPWRISLNEVAYQYVNDVNRAERFKLGLEAYKAFFARPDGAMTSTRFPHIMDIKGVVLVSTSNFPVPVPSPLNERFCEEITELESKVSCLERFDFGALPQLLSIFDELAQREPFKLEVNGRSK